MSHKTKFDPIDEALLMVYCGEPCGVCRRPITRENLLEEQDVIFSGYRRIEGKVSRTSHGPCWRDLSDEQKEEMRRTAEE